VLDEDDDSDDVLDEDDDSDDVDAGIDELLFDPEPDRASFR